jgi:hypothetical protein
MPGAVNQAGGWPNHLSSLRGRRIELDDNALILKLYLAGDKWKSRFCSCRRDAPVRQVGAKRCQPIVNLK